MLVFKPEDAKKLNLKRITIWVGKSLLTWVHEEFIRISSNPDRNALLVKADGKEEYAIYANNLAVGDAWDDN